MKHITLLAVSLLFADAAYAANSAIGLPQVSGKPVVEQPAKPLTPESVETPASRQGGPNIFNQPITELGRATALTKPNPPAEEETPETKKDEPEVDVLEKKQAPKKKRSAKNDEKCNPEDSNSQGCSSKIGIIKTDKDIK